MTPNSATDRFTEGFWSIELTMRDQQVTGRQFLCHARNDGEARRYADQMKSETRGVLGFFYQRLTHGMAASPLAVGLKLGRCQEITAPADWAFLERSQLCRFAIAERPTWSGDR